MKFTNEFSIWWNSFRSTYNSEAFFRKQDLAILLSSSNTEEEGGEGRNLQLKRSLTVWHVISYGIAATLGTGIYVTAGQVAKDTAGPSIIFSFLLAGIVSLLSGLCYSEFASKIPISGSAYSFAYVSLGEVVGWFVVWNLTLEYSIAASAIAGGWTSYFNAALNSVGIHLPYWIAGFKVNSWIQISPLSAMIIILCTLVLLRGMKESATLNGIMTAINTVIIIFFVIVGGSYVETSNWTPFFPYGAQGTFAGVGIVFFSYIGFDSVATLAAEVKNPAKTVPIGIIGTLGFVTVIYMIVSLILTGMVSYKDIDSHAPLANAFVFVGKHWIATLVAIGSVTTITATAFASLVGQPRIFYQMAKDGLLFSVFAELDEKGIPRKGTMISGALSAVIAFFFDLEVLLDMISIGTLLAFAIVCGGLLVLRYTPSGPLSPSLGRFSGSWKVFGFSLHYSIGWNVTAFFFASVFFFLKQKINYEASTTGHLFLWVFHSIPLVLTFLPLLQLKDQSLKSKTGFTTPLVPYVPCLGMLMNVWFIMALPWDSILRLFIWTAIGMTIYLTYGIRNSLLVPKNYGSVQLVEDSEAPLDTHTF